MNKANKPSLLQIIQSVIAAMFGVQSMKNRQRDFSTGKALHYILGGILFVIVFVVSLFLIVHIVSSQH